MFYSVPGLAIRMGQVGDLGKRCLNMSVGENDGSDYAR